MKSKSMNQNVTLELVLELAKQLNPVDKVRLVEQMNPSIKQELEKKENTSRKSLRGLWSGIDITEEDINEMRQEIWKNFPSEDI